MGIVLYIIANTPQGKLMSSKNTVLYNCYQYVVGVDSCSAMVLQSRPIIKYDMHKYISSDSVTFIVPVFTILFKGHSIEYQISHPNLQQAIDAQFTPSQTNMADRFIGGLDLTSYHSFDQVSVLTLYCVYA